MITTAAELYVEDPGFRGFMAHWDADRRCPLALVDYLLERDLHRQAECARWCATQPDCEVFCPLSEYRERGGTCGPYPTYMTGGWQFVATDGNHRRPHRVPSWTGAAPTPGDRLCAATPIEAIILLLDAWSSAAEGPTWTPETPCTAPSSEPPKTTPFGSSTPTTSRSTGPARTGAGPSSSASRSRSRSSSPK